MEPSASNSVSSSSLLPRRVRFHPSTYARVKVSLTVGALRRSIGSGKIPEAQLSRLAQALGIGYDNQRSASANFAALFNEPQRSELRRLLQSDAAVEEVAKEIIDEHPVGSRRQHARACLNHTLGVCADTTPSFAPSPENVITEDDERQLHHFAAGEYRLLPGLTSGETIRCVIEFARSRELNAADALVLYIQVLHRLLDNRVEFGAQTDRELDGIADQTRSLIEPSQQRAVEQLVQDAKARLMATVEEFEK
jgi:hypothetical protein